MIVDRILRFEEYVLAVTKRPDDEGRWRRQQNRSECSGKDYQPAGDLSYIGESAAFEDQPGEDSPHSQDQPDKKTPSPAVNAALVLRHGRLCSGCSA